DGLIRHWRDVGARDGERLAGLPVGALELAYRIPEYQLAQLGVLTDDQWAAAVTDHLTRHHGPHAAAAIAPLRADRGEIDPAMLTLVRAARSRVPVALLSNTTDRIHDDLAGHGILEDFDLVLASTDLGVMKPAPVAYQLAARRLGLPPERIFF